MCLSRLHVPLAIMNNLLENFGQFRKSGAKLQPKFPLAICMIAVKLREKPVKAYAAESTKAKKKLESKIKSYIMETREEWDYETLL